MDEPETSPQPPSNKPISPFCVSVYQAPAYSPIEDKYFINKTRKWYGVFDGHGSNICSEYVQRRMPEKLIELVDGGKAVDVALPIAYQVIDEEFMDKYSHLKGMAVGSCALVAAFQEDNIICIANAGDSLAIMARRNTDGVLKPVVLNSEHNTRNIAEVELLRKRTTDPLPIRGAPNDDTPGSRIGGMISVTRALGDGLLKKLHMTLPVYAKHLPYLTSEPEITKFQISSRDEFVILATDGLFEHVSFDDVLGWIQGYLAEHKIPSELEQTSEVVIRHLYQHLAGVFEVTVEELLIMPNKKRLFDDATIIIIFLQADAP